MRIGIIGAGEIVTSAHIPAYKSLGLVIRSIYDLDEARRVAAARVAGAAAAATLEAVLDDPLVEIVDVAVTPDHSAKIVEAALRAGKHVLAQKPLAPTLAEAGRLDRLAAECGRLLVVNQQMRHAPFVRAIDAARHDGRVGPLTHLTFDIDMALPPGEWDSWFARDPRPVISLNTIHLLDTSRFLMGEPIEVTATTIHDETHLRLAGETQAMILVKFAHGWLSIVDRRNAFGELRAALWAEGAGGAIRGRIGMWDDYPVGTDDLLDYRPAAPGSIWEPLPVAGRWVPDAFTGPISELLAAARGGPRPSTDSTDNLRTLALVDGCYASARTGRRIAFGSDGFPQSGESQ